MEQITLQVQGMSCGHCVNTIEGTVSGLKGVQSVNVLLNNGTVEIVFDCDTIHVDTIKEAIEEQGYDVVA